MCLIEPFSNISEFADKENFTEGYIKQRLASFYAGFILEISDISAHMTFCFPKTQITVENILNSVLFKKLNEYNFRNLQ